MERVTDDDRSSTFSRIHPDDMHVQAEGLDYNPLPTCLSNKEKTIFPMFFNRGESGDFYVTLSEFPSDRMMLTPLDEETIPEDDGIRPDASLRRSRAAIRPRSARASRRPTSVSLPPRLPSSPDCDILRATYSEDEENRNPKKRYHRNKRALIKSRQRSYHKNNLPVESKLSQCACNSCWAENLVSISRGAVKPRFPEIYVPSRIADKCEKIFSINRVRMNDKVRVFTYDVCNGKVYDYEEERLDTSCVKKELGDMYTWGGSDSEEDGEDSVGSEDREE